MKSSIFFYSLLLCLSSCSVISYDPAHPQPVSASGAPAESPYLTQDEQGRPVLCWVEGAGDSTMLYFALSADGGRTFGSPVPVPASVGISPHAESMPKVAFRADGTIIAVFGRSRRIEGPPMRFEGELYYVQSFDAGRTWTEPAYLHTDTATDYSRGFFDLATLPDGEVGAVWLDGRRRSRAGSTLVFAKTEGHGGFGTDTEIAETVCQCCRTDLFIDPAGALHITYRDIFQDSIRDMAHLVSTDNGRTFSTPACISPDNWAISGCPHTGPTVAVDEQGMHFFWFTAGGGKGIYHTVRTGNGYTDRVLIDAAAAHPQAAAFPGGAWALAVEQIDRVGERAFSRIGLYSPGADGAPRHLWLSPDSLDATYPVLVPAPAGGLVAAWIADVAGETQVFTRYIDPEELPREAVISQVPGPAARVGVFPATCAPH